MTTATEKLLKNIDNYYLTPSIILDDILDVLELGLNGDDIVDPTNPWCFLLGATATGVAAAINKSESIARRLYPQLAITRDDLSYHLSDRQYADIFATPASTSLNLLLPLDLVIGYAVQLNPNNTTKTIIIPRNTIVTVAGYELSLCYPIVIDLLESGIILTYYDTTIISPSLIVKNNLLPNKITNYTNAQYLQITAQAVQLNSETFIYSLTGLSSFSYNLLFTDYFCYARAFINLGTNDWQEIKTSYNNKIYDINEPTIIVTVLEDSITITLPDIYQTLNTIGNSIRIDVYTCKGEVSYNLEQITSNDFSINFLDYDTYSDNPAVKAVNNINDILIYSTNFILGGKKSKSFDEIKRKIIYFEDVGKPPIRYSDIDLYLRNYNYILETIKDNITNRIYVACKDLPTVTTNNLAITPLTTLLPVTLNIIGNRTNNYDLTDYNDSLITNIFGKIVITTKAIFKINEDLSVSMLTNTERTTLLSLSKNNLVIECNSTRYFYSPFSYIMDFTEPTLQTIPVDFTDIKITERYYLDSNKKIDYGINTLNTTIELENRDYILTLYTSASSGLTNVFAQLVYIDPNTSTRYHINNAGVVENGQFKFTFTLGNTFNVINSDQIKINNFKDDFGNINTDLIINIESEFKLFYLVQQDNTNYSSDFDSYYIYNSELPRGSSPAVVGVVGATYEAIRVQFCRLLKEIYSPNNEKISTPEYQRYTAPVYETYIETVYKMTSSGKEYTINPDNTVNFTILHNVGDPMLDINGDPIVKHDIGDYLTDINGNFIPVFNSKLNIQRLVNLFAVDGNYLFPTFTDTVNYRNTIPNIIKNYIDNEIKPLSMLLNEQTELYYKPQGDYRPIQVKLDNLTTVIVPNQLSVEITFYLSSFDTGNVELKNNIEKTTRQLLVSFIKNTTLSESDFIYQLEKLLGDSVPGFKVNSLLPNGYPILTILDSSKSFYIKEQLTLLPNGETNVSDTIKINFKQLM